MGTTYRERRERRAARREQWAESRDTKATASREGAKAIADAIPFGQPILVGHHSEKRARKDADRIQGGFRKAAEHEDMATHHRQAADTIRHQLDNSVYDDDEDACERLRDRIAEREAERERTKAVNRAAAKACREQGIKRHLRGWQPPIEEVRKASDALKLVWERMDCTAEEKRDTLAVFKHQYWVGYPPYALSNLGAKIRRDQKRLARLEAAQAT